MNVLGSIAGLGGIIACCAVLWVLFLVVLVVWYWRNQPAMEVSPSAPEPPIQASIEHPTAETPSAASAPAAEAPAEEPPAPPSADA